MNKNLVSKVFTAAVSITTVVSLSGAAGLMPAVAHGATLEELMAQIAALQAQLVALQGSASSSGSSAASSALLSSGNLTLGSTGAAVMELQKFLNANGAQVAASGAGSPGNESSYFGSLTRSALAKWQAANGVSPAVGYFGPVTRAKMATVSSSAPAAGGSPAAPAPMGTGLTVRLAPDQPAASLAPANASRVPFTKVQLTASADGDVTVTSLVVERTGLAADAALSAVLLLDENGSQLGLKKTLSSEHRASVGEAAVVKAGTTRTFTVAANRADFSTYAGQTLALAVVGVNTSANVNATFPMTGATHTVNESLTIGAMAANQLARGTLDPGASATKEIGTTGYTFSAVKATAPSAEKVYWKSVRWNQTGSAASGDLSNVKTWVDGVSYDATVSADGKYYTSTFPGNGLLMDKGFSKEASIKGDITGGSSRTIDFDIAKQTDLVFVGETYGYGIVPSLQATAASADGSAFNNAEDPFYDAAQVLVSSGTMTVSSWTGVQASNVAENLSDQVLGGWTVDVKGEAISVATIKLAVAETGSASDVADITGLKLVDASGKVLAGPLDATDTDGYQVLTFSDTVTFPVGVTNMKLLGKLGTDFVNNDTIVASTTPSTWGNVTGTVTGNSITPSPASPVASQTMTLKAAALSISVSSVPIAQTVIAGVNQFEFARYILDTSGSGEDVRLTSLPLEHMASSGSMSDLQNCKLYDGSTVLNSSDVKNPTANASSTAFTFDGSGLTLTRGTTKQLSLKCDLKASATGSYKWGYDSDSNPSPTGLTSGQEVSESETDSSGQLMTAATSGTLTVALDSSSPSYALSSPGQTVELSRIKFSAVNEDVTLKQLALQLNGAASNTPTDLVSQMVTIHTTDGTKVGEATFSTGDTATSSALSVVVPKDGSKVLVLKGTLAGISVSGPLTVSGDLLKLDFDGDNKGLNGTYGTGVSSGATVGDTASEISGGDTASNGARIMKSYPTLEQVALSSSERTLIAGDAKPLYKFKVTANNGDVALYKMSFSVSSSTAAGSNATTTKFGLYAFTDSGMSTPDANFNGTNNPGGLVNSGFCYNGRQNSYSAGWGGNLGTGSALVEIYPDQTACAQGTTTLVVPSGATRWFKLVASVGTLAASGTSENLQVQLEGDAAHPALGMGNVNLDAASIIDGDSNDDFIWSPVSTTTSNLKSDQDWTNGYGVVGLPSTNMTAETLSK